MLFPFKVEIGDPPTQTLNGTNGTDAEKSTTFIAEYEIIFKICRQTVNKHQGAEVQKNIYLTPTTGYCGLSFPLLISER